MKKILLIVLMTLLIPTASYSYDCTGFAWCQQFERPVPLYNPTGGSRGQVYLDNNEYWGPSTCLLSISPLVASGCLDDLVTMSGGYLRGDATGNVVGCGVYTGYISTTETGDCDDDYSYGHVIMAAVVPSLPSHLQLVLKGDDGNYASIRIYTSETYPGYNTAQVCENTMGWTPNGTEYSADYIESSLRLDPNKAYHIWWRHTCAEDLEIEAESAVIDLYVSRHHQRPDNPVLTQVLFNASAFTDKDVEGAALDSAYYPDDGTRRDMLHDAFLHSCTEFTNAPPIGEQIITRKKRTIARAGVYGGASFR